MAEKVTKLGVERDNAFMYFIKEGDLWRVPRERTNGKPGQPEIVSKVGAKVNSKYIYFLDCDGDIARAKRATGGSNTKPTKQPSTTQKAT